MNTVNVIFNNQTLSVKPSEISIPSNSAFHELGIKAWDVNNLSKIVFESEEIKISALSLNLLSLSSAFICILSYIGVLAFPFFFYTLNLSVFLIALPVLFLISTANLSIWFSVDCFKKIDLLKSLSANKKLLNDQVLDNLAFLTSDNSSLKLKLNKRIAKIDTLQEEIGTQFSPEMSIRRKNYNDLLDLLNNAPEILKKAIIT